MSKEAPPVTLTDSDTDFVFSLDLSASHAGFSVVDMVTLLTEAHYSHLYASRCLAGKSFADAKYGQARELLDCALLHLAKAKWHIGGITGAYNGVFRSDDIDADAQSGVEAARTSIDICRSVEQLMSCEIAFEDIEAPKPRLDNDGTEVLRADGVPIVPSICPIVVLRGSSYDMGYQYAQQSLEIFGDFVFATFAKLRFTQGRLDVIKRWEAELRQHTPEVLDMCRGWADGATNAGLPMSYENVLHLWTGSEPPSPSLNQMEWPFLGSKELLSVMYMGQQAFLNMLTEEFDDAEKASVRTPANSPLDHCSGICAWAAATTDGELKAASTTDHDCWMQATIVAYPDNGNAFIYTPFSVAGAWLPGMGIIKMAGHPGMNNKGLAYVHHGGEAHMMEPEESWGYGVARGPVTFHALRYKSSAIEARDYQFEIPIGDVGGPLMSGGGLWADRDNGFAFESRYRDKMHPNGLVRERTYDHGGKGHDLLYAGNSALHAEASDANHGHEPGSLSYDIERGWHTYDLSKAAHPDLMRAWMRMTAAGDGAERMYTFYQNAIPASGSIDETWLNELYRLAASEYPETKNLRSEIVRRTSEKKGHPPASPAHRTNAFYANMTPDNGDQGLYSACVGPLRYDLPPNGANHGYFYYDETNTYWTLRLAKTPEEMIDDAQKRAKRDIEDAARGIRDITDAHAGRKYLESFLDLSQKALAEADAIIASGPTDDHIQEPARLARALRRVTHAQVRARQVLAELQSSSQNA